MNKQENMYCQNCAGLEKCEGLYTCSINMSGEKPTSLSWDVYLNIIMHILW